jgi:hypothetical protein
MRDQAQESDRQETQEMAPQEPETKEAAPRAGHVEEVRAEDRSHFFAVANALIGAIHWQSPQLVLPERLTRRESDGIRLIYEARTAQESEYGGGTLSGLERMKYLNEGMLALQGILAIAKSGSFPQARAHIEEIRRLIARLKEQIAQAIVAEERKKQEEKAKKDQDTKRADEQAKAKQVAEAQTKKG